MGAYDTDLPKMKVPGMENPPAATPQPTTDPLAGFKKQFADLASATQQVGQTLNAPAPKPAPLLGPDAGSTVLPVLQAGDAAMRAVPGAVADAAKAGWDGLKNAVTPPSSNYVGSGPTDPDTNKRPVNAPVDIPGATRDIYNKMIGDPMQAAISSLPDYNPNGGINVRAAAPAPAPDPFAVRPTPAPTTATGNTTAKVETPAPAPAAATTGPTKENGYALPEIAPKTPTAGTQELINRQNASRTPVGDPYAGPAAAKPAGMPAPGTAPATGADLNGTPSQQTAYWAQQKAGLQERERYADQQALQHQYLGMMMADQDFRQNAYQQAISNPNLGPATLAAIAAMTGHNSGAAAPAGQAGQGMVAITDTAMKTAGEGEKNALTARGQDLTFAGHKLTNENDMAKAKLSADVHREGYQSTERVHTADSAARAAQVQATNKAHLKGIQATVEGQKAVADAARTKVTAHPTLPGYGIDGTGKVYDMRRQLGMIKDEK